MKDTEECKPIDWYNHNPEKYAQHIAEAKVINAGLSVITREYVHSILRDAGVSEKSGTDKDYSRCKKLLVGGHWIDSVVYDKVIGYIQEYVGI